MSQPNSWNLRMWWDMASLIRFSYMSQLTRKEGYFPDLSEWAWSHQTSLRCRELSLADGRREVREGGIMRRTPYTTTALKLEGTMGEGRQTALRSWGQPPSQRLARKQDFIHTTSSIVPQGIVFCQQPARAWRQILPQSSQMRGQPSRHLDFNLMRPQAKPSRTHPGSWPSELWDSKWKLLSAAKSVVICYIVIENK